ncbi:hypothetical protein GCM10012288_21370 [Malaciobacter pacificus]|jgi:DNA-directed RNA polymerase subunit RPC12/RpoP|uniref:Putative membrane protein n=1 Tax=Malaciobacter pacificus TaxID=1080223 RepID=A0A5C2HF44_9BACT|nr:hypothetical protein [Malaciobacter pacificus]QEP35022.1 putative membrane protein [Malaciobacter pacificus]GGD46855.1 hypothetical protein GCM10012288_21370 [Malaciobacter pacificus]
MNTTDCPECGYEILSRLGTVCPKCGHTIGYFEGEKKKKYGKFFALTVFVPFISFITILFSSINPYTFYASIFIYAYLAYKSCPALFKGVTFTKYEKVLFWGVWIIFNAMIIAMIYNNIVKGFESGS